MRASALTDKAGANQKNRITDYFPAVRRSQRKTDGVLKAEKHSLLIQNVEDGVQDGIKKKEFPGKGRGIVATRKFLKHEFVVEYAGELVDGDVAKQREQDYGKDNRVGCYMYYFTYRDHHYCVDATAETDRLGRLLNHSRTGNLIPKILEVNGSPRLILVAKRDIEPGEELTYDYGDRRKRSIFYHPWLAH